MSFSCYFTSVTHKVCSDMHYWLFYKDQKNCRFTNPKKVVAILQNIVPLIAQQVNKMREEYDMLQIINFMYRKLII